MPFSLSLYVFVFITKIKYKTKNVSIKLLGRNVDEIAAMNI